MISKIGVMISKHVGLNTKNVGLMMTWLRKNRGGDLKIGWVEWMFIQFIHVFFGPIMTCRDRHYEMQPRIS